MWFFYSVRLYFFVVVVVVVVVFFLQTPTLDQTHQKHSIKLKHIDEKDTIGHICRETSTLFEVLKNNKKCRKYLGKNVCPFFRKKDNDIAIPLHFPCWLIKSEVFLKNVPGKNFATLDPKIVHHGKQETFIFYIQREGGKNCASKKFVDVRKVDKKCSFLCVYAFSGETVKQALKRDGRFLPGMLKNFSELRSREDDCSYQMGTEVTEEFHERYFEVEMQRGAKRPRLGVEDEQESSQELQDTPIAETKEVLPTCSDDVHAKGSSTDNHQSTAGQDSKGSKEKMKNPASQGILYKIADSTEVLEILRSQFEALVSHMKSRNDVRTYPQVLNLLKKEFGKNTQGFSEVRTIKRLMNMSDSVCQIESPKMKGTGFLLFHNFVLTNEHVIHDSVVEHISVIFNYGEGNEDQTCSKVKNIVACCHDERNLDYALLEVDVPIGLQPLLAAYKGFPKSGGICLIGHPEGGVKKMDPTSIIEFDKKVEAVVKDGKNQIFLQYFRSAKILDEFNLWIKEQNVVTYDTCFFEGSSGSPVLTEDFGLIAMHTGGFFYGHGKTQSVIEYGIPLGQILDDLISKMIKQGQHGVLLEFLTEAVNSNSLTFYTKRSADHLMQVFKSCFELVDTTVLNELRKRGDFLAVTKKLRELLTQEKISSHVTSGDRGSESVEDMEVD